MRLRPVQFTTMGRAPNPGGTKRVSADVVPKAKPHQVSATSDEEEKTTTESQWEDEASTTVEQGDVAERIRGLAEAPRRTITNITNTSAESLEESTVDDQSAHPMLAPTPVPRDVP